MIIVLLAACTILTIAALYLRDKRRTQRTGRAPAPPRVELAHTRYWVYTSAGLMIVGSFGPWAKVLSMTVSGTDGSNDGWLVVAAAAVAAATFARTPLRVGSIVAFCAGLVGAAITIYDRYSFGSTIENGGELAGAIAHIGWGLNVAMLASISLVIAANTAFRHANSMTHPDSHDSESESEIDPAPAPHLEPELEPEPDADLHS